MAFLEGLGHKPRKLWITPIRSVVTPAGQTRRSRTVVEALGNLDEW